MSSRLLLAVLLLLLPACRSAPAPLARRAPSADPGAAPASSAPCSLAAQPDAPWYATAVGYEVFVRSFQDSDGDGVGDLRGLTARLDYLNDGDPSTMTDLGVDLLWLMPTFESPSYHGYDVTDYRGVNPAYGTLQDLDALLQAAHARGIRVLLDLVLNHTSSQHPWFLDAATPASAHRDFYVWSPTFLPWTRPWGGGPVWHKRGEAYYYALFWEGMPDLNLTNPSVQDELLAIARFWIDRGLDGFRLDAARYLVETGPGPGQADTPATHVFWQRLRAQDPSALLLGEVWTDTATVARYYGTPAAPELQMTFDFDLSSALIAAIQQQRPGRVRQALCARIDGLPEGAAAATFLTNHDMIRVATQLEAQGPAALRLAAALLLTLPGTPFIYYGEELGLENGPGGDDRQKRLPMPWTAARDGGFTTGTPWEPLAPAPAPAEAQRADPQSLQSLYRRLIALRRATPALQRGSARFLSLGGAPSLLAMERVAGTSRVVLLWNFAEEPATASLSEAGPLRDASSGTTYAPVSGAGLRVPLEPRGFAVLIPPK